MPHELRKKKYILSAIKSSVTYKTLNFGIEVPQTVEDTPHLDSESGINAIAKEIRNLLATFDVQRLL